MEEHWKDENVSLDVLSEQIIKFFEDKGFTTYIKKSYGDHHIIAKPMLHLNLIENIHIFLQGQPNDFVVRFVAGSHSHKLWLYGLFTSLVGGGFFALKSLKSEETIEKLEREFRTFLTAKIRQLENTANSTSR